LPKAHAGTWMDPAEVTAWIAFRNPLPHTKWDEFTNDKLSRPWPEWGFKRGIVAMEDQARPLLSALQTRAERRVWRVPNADAFDGGWLYPFRAHVRRLMRKHATSAAALAVELEQDIATHTRAYTALAQAQQEMIAAVREERLELLGHEAKGDGQSDPSAVAKRIDGVLFLGPRTIDLDGWVREDSQLSVDEWAGYRGPYFDRLHFRTREVMALWPERLPADNSVSGRTGAQGRPTSRHLVEREFQRRVDRNAVLSFLKDEAQALSNWLTVNHPGFPPMTRKTVESCIRAEYNRQKTSK
jgi:hypothetical protein